MGINVPKVFAPRDIVVFFPQGNSASPPNLARELLARLRVGHADIGVDALTGGVEVRLRYDPALLRAVRDWLGEHSGVIADLASY